MAQLPLFPLEVVLFPGMSLPLHIFEPRYRQLVAECLERRSRFGVVLESGGERSAVGCAAEIVQVLHRYPDGRLDILTEGRDRFRILEIDEEMPYLQASIEWLEERAEDVDAARARVLDLYRRTFWVHGQGIAPSQVEAAPFMSFMVGRSSLLGLRDRQRLLELAGESERLDALEGALEKLEPIARRMGGNGHHTE